MAKNDGKVTERLFDHYYTMQMEHNPDLVYYRFVDSNLAHSLTVGTQPADRLLIHKGQATLIELKSSIDPVRFPLKNISKKQIGYGRRWTTAGANSMFIIQKIDVVDKFFFLPFSEVHRKLKSKKASWRWEELAEFEKDYTWKFWL
jgi:penicillin-binding protein-related factor A (putative recombinase)